MGVLGPRRLRACCHCRCLAVCPGCVIVGPPRHCLHACRHRLAGPCRRPCPGHVVGLCLSGLGQMEGGTYSGALTMTMNDESVVHHLVATSLTATWHLHFVLEKKKGGGSELAHLGASSPVSVHRCWSSFVRGGVVCVLCVRSWAFFVVCSRSGGHWGE